MENNYRFLGEYANHKKREIKKYWPKDYQAGKLEEVDKIVWSAHRGYIILDEAMRLLSEV